MQALYQAMICYKILKDAFSGRKLARRPSKIFNYPNDNFVRGLFLKAFLLLTLFLRARPILLKLILVELELNSSYP